MSKGALATRTDARAEGAHELLVEQLRALTTSEQWLTMLETSRRFHTYSARNVLLLLAQGAQGQVAGYRTWQTIPAEPGGTCQVRKGAHALTILAPITRDRHDVDADTRERTTRRVLVGFKPVRVFDETALVDPPAAPQVMPELLRGASPDQLFNALAAQVRAANFTLQDGDCAPANGRTDWTTRTVTVRADLDPAQRTKTLAHELAHIRLHDPERNAEHRVSRERMEVEAESVAYLVCAHAGIDSARYTLPYVAHWSAGDIELVQATAERAIDTARSITDRLDAAIDSTRAPAPMPTESLQVSDAQHPAEVHEVIGLRDFAATRDRGTEEDVELAAVRHRVEREAARLLTHLADNPESWGADPKSHDAIRQAAAAANPPATPAVATARRRLTDIIEHPAAPEPADLMHIPDVP